jgi:hypothetical protein
MILCKNSVSAALRLSLLKARGCGPTFEKKNIVADKNIVLISNRREHSEEEIEHYGWPV